MHEIRVSAGLFLGSGRYKGGEEVNIGWQNQEMPEYKFLSMTFVLYLSPSLYLSVLGFRPV